MEFYKQIKKYDETITKLLKKQKSAFFADTTKALTYEQIYTSDEAEKLTWKDFYSPEKYNYYHFAYMELPKYIYYDYYYQELLSAALNDESGLFANTIQQYPKIDILNYEDDFHEAFDSLILLWNKYESSSEKLDNFMFSWEIFKVLHSKYPVLCQESFPIVLFILADSYYDFCKVCYKYKKHQNLPEQISPKQKEQILSLFYERISGNYWHYYLFSLIDTKPTSYSESSFNEGQNIYKSLVKKTETINTTIADNYNDIISAHNEMEQIILKRYMHRLKSKNEHRKQTNSNYTPITPGENLQVLWKFLHAFSNNKWCKYNLAFTLYVLNNMSGWLNFLLLSQYKTIDKFAFSYYLNPTLPATLFYVTDCILMYDTVHCISQDNIPNMGIESGRILNTKTLIHLRNTFKLVDFIDYYNDFPKWCHSANNKDLSLLKTDAEKIYNDIFRKSKPDLRINLDGLSKLLSCYLYTFPSDE